MLAIFGAGFGLTVTPRSTAAVETAGRASFGMASAIVTVARMIGMAIGVAVLTAYGSTTINHLYDELFAVPDGWKEVIPADLRDRPLRDAFVVDALEAWAAGKASEILVGSVRRRRRRHDRRDPARPRPYPRRAYAGGRSRRRAARGGAPAGGRWTRRTTADDRPLTRPVPSGSSAGRRRASARASDVSELAGIVADPEARFWIDLTRARSGGRRAPSPRILGLHPLIADDIADRNERAKVATYDDMVHVVLFDLEYAARSGPTRSTSSSANGSCYRSTARTVTSRSDAGPRRHRPGASPRARTSCCTRSPTGSSTATSRSSTRWPTRSTTSRTRSSNRRPTWTLQRLFVLKRELLAIRRATSPAREVLNQLTNRELTVIVDPTHLVYFRDVYDHLIRVTDELDNYRELVGGTLDIYLSTVNNNLSRIMKRLTGVTVILAGIGAIAGIFGMSEAGASPSPDGEATGFWLVTADRASARRSRRSSCAGSTGSEPAPRRGRRARRRLAADDRFRLRVGCGVVGRAAAERLGEDLERGSACLSAPRTSGATASRSSRQRVVEPVDFGRGGGPR